MSWWLNIAKIVVLIDGTPDTMKPSTQTLPKKVINSSLIIVVEQKLHSIFDHKIQFIFNAVPKVWANYDSYCQLIPDNSDADCYNMIPRIGAFEVTYQGIIVYSKLLS